MRVQFLVTCFPTDERPMDGIFHQTQVRALVRRGVEVEVVAPVPWVPPGLGKLSKRWGQFQRIPRLTVADHVAIHRRRYLQWPRGNYWTAPHRSFAACARSCASSRPDLIHGHFAYPSGLGSILAARSWGIPSVVTLHGADVNRVPYVNGRMLRLFREVVLRADSIIAVSQALAATTEQLAGRRPTVLPIGIDLMPYQSLPSRAAAREALGLPADSTILLFVGRLVVDKGILETLESLESFEGRLLGIFVGDGPLRGHVEKTRTARAVGMQRPEVVRVYFAAADLLVLSSHHEGMPTVLIEAGAAELPIVASAVGGIPELLSQGRGLLVPPASPTELARRIRTVLEDPAAAKSRATRLKKFILEFYDVHRNAANLQEIYRALLVSPVTTHGSIGTVESGLHRTRIGTAGV